MTLEKAIEILDLNVRQRSPKMPPDVKDALQLGSEALKRITACRATNDTLIDDSLIGETFK